ncbi:MAG: hypothetical protein MI865_00705 [Proteobacteria bacterium]|nr:hypothetical protein [Pseudomonadota bacterium]
MTRAFAVLFLAIIATIVAAKLLFEFTTQTGAAAESNPWSNNRMEFVAWNNERWTGTVRDGAFELVPLNTNDWSRHTNSTLAYIDWNGEPWQAKLDGDAFLLAYRGDWNGDTVRANAIQYRDWQDSEQLRTVSQLTR